MLLAKNITWTMSYFTKIFSHFNNQQFIIFFFFFFFKKKKNSFQIGNILFSTISTYLIVLTFQWFNLNKYLQYWRPIKRISKVGNMMSSKCMIKLMSVMMELVILIILEVNANDRAPFSFAPSPLTTILHPFQMSLHNFIYSFLCSFISSHLL